ncbi:hypothetical protein TNCV_3141551 [Trichonephila clavipes]|nr:hypothetical protein TNCV_3141551 [Trichonephila clavipes]
MGSNPGEDMDAYICVEPLRDGDTVNSRRVESPLMSYSSGRGSRVIWVSDRGWLCHEFEPSTTKDPPCRAAMHAKYRELKRPPVGVVW